MSFGVPNLLLCAASRSHAVDLTLRVFVPLEVGIRWWIANSAEFELPVFADEIEHSQSECFPKKQAEILNVLTPKQLGL